MRPGKHGQSDNLHIFLQRGVDNHLRGLSQTSIDYFHARIAESLRDHLGAAVMAIKASFWDETGWALS